jgi:hypothetical protein
MLQLPLQHLVLTLLRKLHALPRRRLDALLQRAHRLLQLLHLAPPARAWTVSVSESLHPFRETLRFINTLAFVPEISLKITFK